MLLKEEKICEEKSLSNPEHIQKVRDLIGGEVQAFDSFMAKEIKNSTGLKDAMKFREFWKEIDMLLI